MAGFVLTVAGIGVLLAMVQDSPSAWAFAPGLLLIGLGIGRCSPPRSTWCSRASPTTSRARSRACRGACPTSARRLGTAIAGTILVAGIAATPGRSYALATVAVGVIGLVGLVAAVFLPAKVSPVTAQPAPSPTAQ